MLPKTIIEDLKNHNKPGVAEVPEALPLPGQAATPEVPEAEVFNTGNVASEAPFQAITDAPPSSDSADKPKQTAPTQAGKGVSIGNLISGRKAIDFSDAILPSLLVFAVAQTGYEVEKKRLQLTKDEKELIAPFMQDVLDKMNVDFSNPYYNLAFVMGSVYATKFIDILPDIKKKSKKPVPEKEQKKTEVDKAKEALEREKEEARKREEEASELKTLDREVAIKLIMKTKKMNRERATNYYNKTLK